MNIGHYNASFRFVLPFLQTYNPASLIMILKPSSSRRMPWSLKLLGIVVNQPSPSADFKGRRILVKI